jgi:nucleoside triphosphate diphosphatase
VMEAGKLGSRASKVGFDWPDSEGLFAKLQEEIEELQAEIKADSVDQDSVNEELGDLMFTAVNLARHLKVDPESALRSSNAKFRKRFGAIEDMAGGFEALSKLGPVELDALWNKAKLQKVVGRDKLVASKPDAPAVDGRRV